MNLCANRSFGTEIADQDKLLGWWFAVAGYADNNSSSVRDWNRPMNGTGNHSACPPS